MATAGSVPRTGICCFCERPIRWWQRRSRLRSYKSLDPGGYWSDRSHYRCLQRALTGRRGRREA